MTALAFVLTIGDVARFAGSKQLTSYLGLVPSEQSSGNKRRLGAITKQGNCFLRKLLVEAAQTTVRKDEGFRKRVSTPLPSWPESSGQGGGGRELAVRLSLMLRSNVGYPEIVHMREQPAGAPGRV